MSILRDLKFTLRTLAKAPVFAGVAIVTIALGIGANTAIFSVINEVLLRTLPVPNPQQLVYFHLKNQPLNTSQTGYDDMSFSLPIFNAIRKRQDVFSDVIGFVPLNFEKTAVRVDGGPEEVYGEMVSGNFFSGLQIQPLIGRGFTVEDESSHAAVAVLNYGWWKSRFDGGQDVLGKVFYVKGLPFTVIGVAPADFNGVDPNRPSDQFWIPLQNRPELNAWGSPAAFGTLYGSPNFLAMMMLGRLQPGITPAQASARIGPEFENVILAGQKFDPKIGEPGTILTGIHGVESLHDDYQQPLRFLMMMVGVVLVIACANVVMLLLARNSGRLAEFSLRRALGANTRTLAAQLLLESVVMVGAGVALAWLIANVATQAMAAWSGVDIIVQPDRRVMLFTAAVSVLVALALGLAPVRLVTRQPLNLALRSTSGTGASQRNTLLGRRLAVALQISLCTVLLFSAGLLFRTLRNLEAKDLGMRTSGLLVFGVTPESTIHTDAEAIRFHNALLDRVRALPGVDSATIMENRIGAGDSSNDGILVDGKNPMPARAFAPARENFVSGEFLKTLGIPLRLGRAIADSDDAAAPKVAVINQKFADGYLPGVNPLGHQIASIDDATRYTIVGVAANSRYTDVQDRDRPTAYIPYAQSQGVSTMQYELHTSGDPRLLVPEAAALVREVDPNLPLERPITQQAQFEESIAQQRLAANLSVLFAALAGFLVAIGLYGTVSYSVARRTMEIGVRMAVGAQRKQVLWMILRESLYVAALGLAIGIPAALAVSRAMRSMLYGLGASDPLSIGVALVAIAAVTLAAALVPARRATTIDPMQALRME